MIACNSYIENEDIPENKVIFLFGFKHIKLDKVDKYLLIGCGSDESYENDKLFIFSSKKITNKDMEWRNFKIKGWSFMTLHNFFKIQSIVSK